MVTKTIEVNEEQSATGRLLPFRQSLMAVLGICFVGMLVGLDQTIVGTALPTIVAELNGFELYAWVGTSYLLTSVITVPICGRLSDYYGRKPFVVASVIIFTIASMLCGMAGDMTLLVLARALQGIGGGMLVGTAFACVPDLFPDAKVRLRWQILLSSSFGVASAVGPSLGGFLTEYYGWRSVFYVNLPVGLISLFFIWQYLPLIRYRRDQAIRLDWQGALLIALFLGCLQLAVELFATHGVSWQVAVFSVASVLAFISLILWERRCAYPLLPLEVFRDRSLATMFILSLLTGFVMFGMLFYIPLLLQSGFGLSPNDAGMLVTPLVVCITFGSILSGRVVIRLARPNLILYMGFVLTGIAVAGVVLYDRHMSQWLFVAYMTLGGVGLGFIMPNLTIFSQELSGRSNLGIVTALVQSIRMIGGMLGTAIIGAMVNFYFVAGIQQEARTMPSQEMVGALSDPQLLVRPDSQTELIAQMAALGQDARPWLLAAREHMVGAIESGLIVVLIVNVVALLWLFRLPLIRFNSLVSTRVEQEPRRRRRRLRRRREK
ncbi:DSBA oxidoreductase [Advenella kashmirensis W13003]|uniref:DSBA oxidoreductase n=1 Tax=Advenella kashmirensis W13003 TaxID=1424334 RepID=V8QN23_9BURK|nr:MDR family MFS transporter [Advenella kashmirensis]ETF00394.1 DSBA oxidoreductase [Advenella kashmirensis W13003]